MSPDLHELFIYLFLGCFFLFRDNMIILYIYIFLFGSGEEFACTCISFTVA